MWQFACSNLIGLGELTESNGYICDDTLSGIGGSGLVVVRCLQNMALSIMTKLYNGLWVFQANLSSYKHITQPKDKKKKKKKKKDEEQDNPADVQDNNVLT
jgi:hypothetical protein